MGGLSWLSRLFRTVQLILCNSIRNLTENVNYTCRLFVYESLWKETVTTGQNVSAGQIYQNKIEVSVLKLSICSSTSPENWQNLKDEFFGIRQYLHIALCARFSRLPTLEMCNGNVRHLFTTCIDQVPVHMKTDTNEFQNNYSMKSVFTERNIRELNWTFMKNLTPSKFADETANKISIFQFGLPNTKFSARHHDEL